MTEEMNEAPTQEASTETVTEVREPIGGISESSEASTTETPEFAIPDEYQEKGWSKNIKSIDDLWKMNDNAQGLIGKKTVGVPDFDNASEEELNEWYSKIRPESTDAYNFYTEDTPDATKELFNGLFHGAGLNVKQAQMLNDGVNQWAQSQQQALMSDAGFKEALQNKIGDGWEGAYDSVKPVMSSNLSQESKDALNKMPNEQLAIFVEFANNVKKQYGIDDNSKMGDAKGNPTAPVDVIGEHAKLVQERIELSRNPNATPDMVKAVNDKILKLNGAI